MSTRVEVLAVHAWACIVPVDASSGDTIDPASMRPLEQQLELRLLSTHPGLRIIAKPGLIGLSYEEGALHPADSDREDWQPPARADEAFSAELRAGRAWLPRRFTTTLSRAQRVLVPMFRSPVGSLVDRNGSLITSLVDAGGAPVPWAVVICTVTTAPAQTVTCRAQADANGDVILLLRQLPPLPEGVTEYQATVRVERIPGAAAESIPDLAALTPSDCGSPSEADAMDPSKPRMVSDFNHPIVPGARARLRSFGQTSDRLVVQP